MKRNCKYKDCKKECRWNKTTGYYNGYYCHLHARVCSINYFLCHLYSDMKRRVEGRSSAKWAYLYIGKPIMAKEVFVTWSKNHPDFLTLYKQWVTSDFDRKLTPSINRINSNKGYVLGNVEWITNSQNCSLAGVAKKIKAKKSVYRLLGVAVNE